MLAVGGTVMKYTVPGRRLHREGVPTASLLTGVVFAIIGFFVIPVIGLFVAGVFVAQLVRLKTVRLAWSSAWQGIKAVGLSMVIEILSVSSYSRCG